jgi:hypothetical protein
VGDEIFHTCPDRPWDPPSLLYNGYFLGIKWPGRGIDHPLPSSAEVKERVYLYLYSPNGPLWSVLWWTVPLPSYLYSYIYCTHPLFLSYYFSFHMVSCIPQLQPVLHMLLLSACLVKCVDVSYLYCDVPLLLVSPCFFSVLYPFMFFWEVFKIAHCTYKCTINAMLTKHSYVSHLFMNNITQERFMLQLPSVASHQLLTYKILKCNKSQFHEKGHTTVSWRKWFPPPSLNTASKNLKLTSINQPKQANSNS